MFVFLSCSEYIDHDRQTALNSCQNVCALNYRYSTDRVFKFVTFPDLLSIRYLGADLSLRMSYEAKKMLKNRRNV